MSTAYFPTNYKLILAGVSYNNYYKKLKFLIKKNNLKKVTLLKDVNYSKWFEILKKGDLGIAFYDPVNTSHKIWLEHLKNLIIIFWLEYHVEQK